MHYAAQSRDTHQRTSEQGCGERTPQSTESQKHVAANLVAYNIKSQIRSHAQDPTTPNTKVAQILGQPSRELHLLEAPERHGNRGDDVADDGVGSARRDRQGRRGRRGSEREPALAVRAPKNVTRALEIFTVGIYDRGYHSLGPQEQYCSWGPQPRGGD